MTKTEYMREYRKDPDRRRKNKEATVRSRVKRLYGVTQIEYDRMFSEQGGTCAIYHQPEIKGYRLAVDHHHISGKIRGLLCKRCNQALGGFKDDPEILIEAIKYLGRG